MAKDTLFGLQILYDNEALNAASGGDLLTNWKAHIDSAAALGVDVIRLPGDWRGVQGDGPGQYSQWYLDAVGAVTAYAKDLGIKVVVNFAHSPHWATDGSHPDGTAESLWSPPLGANVAHYVSSLLKVHEAIKAAGALDTVVGWEIWNEPNTTTYWKNGGVRANTDVQIELSEVQNYVNVLNQSYDALKAADPAAVVLGGSLAGCDFDYLAKMYELGAKFDGLAVHPYPKANPFNNGLTYGPNEIDSRDPLALVWSFKPGADALRAMMVAQGDANKKMWFTEFGWSSDSSWGAAGSPEKQAAYITEAMNYVPAMDYVAAAINFRGYDVPGNTFGMYDFNGAMKPSGLALREFMFDLHPKKYESIVRGLEADFVAQSAMFRHAETKVTVDLRDLNARLDGPNLKNIVGSAFADSLTGSNGFNKLFGQSGKDKLVGRGGDDTLDGGRGRDVITGALGADKLWGGAGPDTFDYNNIKESSVSSRDTVFDFTSGLDKIDLSTIDAVAGSAANQAFRWIGFDQFSGAAGQLRQAYSPLGVIIEGDVNGDRTADIQIVMANGAALQAFDFIL